jgi:hypothetical protein
MLGAFASMPRSKAAARRQGRQGRQLAELLRCELDLGSDALGDLASLIETHFAVDVSLSSLGTGAATVTRRVHRAPERLARRAISAAQQQRLGLSVVASLLGRDDDEQLWADVMGPVLPDDTTLARPVPL